MIEEESIEEMAEQFQDSIKEKKDDYIKIQNIINKLIDTIIDYKEKKGKNKYYYISKVLNFPEKIIVKSRNNEIISIELPDFKFSNVDSGGTRLYFDDEKILFNQTTFFQEIIFNIGKILFLLLNGFQFSSKKQLIKNNKNIRAFEIFLRLTLKYYTWFNSNNDDLKKLWGLKLNVSSEQLDKEIKEIKNLSEISSIIQNKSIIDQVDIDNDCLYKGKDYFMSFNYGKDIIESSFSIKRNQSLRKKEKEFEDNEAQFFEEINKKISKDIDKIVNLYKGPIP